MIITPPSSFHELVTLVMDFLLGYFQYGLIAFLFLGAIGLLISYLFRALNLRN